MPRLKTVPLDQTFTNTLNMKSILENLKRRFCSLPNVVFDLGQRLNLLNEANNDRILFNDQRLVEANCCHVLADHKVDPTHTRFAKETRRRLFE